MDYVPQSPLLQKTPHTDRSSGESSADDSEPTQQTRRCRRRQIWCVLAVLLSLGLWYFFYWQIYQLVVCVYYHITYTWPGDVWGEYSETDALRFLQYARTPFCAHDRLRDWSCGEPCEMAPVVPGSVHFLGPGAMFAAEGIVAKQLPEAEGKCIVAFRGTLSKINWLANFVNVPTRLPFDAPWCGPWTGCLVHMGTIQAYADLREQLFEALETLQCKSADVTGHSLGAALGTFAAVDLRATKKLPGTAYLFGAPRLGNVAFAVASARAAAETRSSTWRVVHYHDLVPRINAWLPPTWYWHVPREVYYDEPFHNYTVCSRNGEDLNCANAVPAALCTTKDHLMYYNVSFQYFDLPAVCRVPKHAKITSK